MWSWIYELFNPQWKRKQEFALKCERWSKYWEQQIEEARAGDKRMDLTVEPLWKHAGEFNGKDGTRASV